MAVKRPALAQLHTVPSDLGMTLSDDDVRSFLGLMEGSFAAYDAVDAMPDHIPIRRDWPSCDEPALRSGR